MRFWTVMDPTTLRVLRLLKESNDLLDDGSQFALRRACDVAVETGSALEDWKAAGYPDLPSKVGEA